jgi:hypothetical protein
MFINCVEADAVEYSPFFGIEKGAVLQEARVFNDPQLDARKCSQVSIAYSSGVSLILYDNTFNCIFVPYYSHGLCHLLDICPGILQVITKLLYLLNQGETFTKV